MLRYPFRSPGSASLYQYGPNRPLSDIRETTEPSLIESSIHKPQNKPVDSLAEQLRVATPVLAGDAQPERRNDTAQCHPIMPNHMHVPHEIPASSIPPRSSSRSRMRIGGTTKPGESEVHSASLAIAPTRQCSPPRVCNQRKAISPVKDAVAPSKGDFKGSKSRIPSKTLLRLDTRALQNVIDHPTLLHPRIRVDLQPSAPLFVGGSTVEGSLRILVDEADRVRYRKTLTIERACVDLLGVEELAANKRSVFLALSNEIIDWVHPPPAGMVESTNSMSLQGRSWTLVPSVAVLPFLITLPLEVGPPTFTSKHARIRYILSATLVIKDCGRQLSIRNSQPTFILSVYDPEKALVSLPSPLTASDKYVSHSRVSESVSVTAGLHRQVWVSGTTIFVDVHIANKSRKTIGRIELQLERAIVFYKCVAAGALEELATRGRLLEQVERSIICKSVLRQGQQGWTGVKPFENCLRTCDLELPRGHTTVKRTKYFEVCFNLNIIVTTLHHKIVTVQLPVFLIHMNSLDIPSNSVAQVAAAIDEKRGFGGPGTVKGTSGLDQDPNGSLSGGLEGRAFSAPRKRSLEQERAREMDISALTRELEASPRKSPRRNAGDGCEEESTAKFGSPRRNRRGRIFLVDEADALRQQFSKITEEKSR